MIKLYAFSLRPQFSFNNKIINKIESSFGSYILLPALLVMGIIQKLYVISFTSYSSIQTNAKVYPSFLSEDIPIMKLFPPLLSEATVLYVCLALLERYWGGVVHTRA